MFDFDLSDDPSCLLTSSKKIKKISKSSKPKKVVDSFAFDDDVEELFNFSTDNFNKKEKLKVLDSIKSRISQLQGLQWVYLSQSNSSSLDDESIDWLQCLDKLGSETFNTFLNEIIPRFKPQLAPLNKKALVQFRRRVRSWFKAEMKPEIQGRTVVPLRELPVFLDEMKTILTSMTSKNFKDLKKRVQDVLQDIYQRLGREFKGNEFSKHYWWEFQENHKSIKELWKALPQKRCKKSATEKLKMESGMSPSSVEDPSPFSVLETEENQTNCISENNSVQDSDIILPQIDFEMLEKDLGMTSNFSSMMSQEIPIIGIEEDWLSDLKKEWEQSNQISCQFDFSSLF